MMELQQETILAKVRLHWGIFIPVLVFGMGPILASLPVIFIFQRLGNGLSQMGMPFNQANSFPNLNLILLRALTPYCVVIVGLLLGTWFTYLKSEVTLTDRRLIYRTGLLSKRCGEVALENVVFILIVQSLSGRMWGYGSIMVTTVGGAIFPLWFMGSPENFHSMVLKAISDAKNSTRPNQKTPPPDNVSRYMPKAK